MPVFKTNNRTVLFIHIPKTGGTSIERFFAARGVSVALWSRELHGPEREGFPCSPQHFQLTVLKALFPESFLDERIAVVRHPVARIVSEYRHRMGIRLHRGKSVVRFESWLRLNLRRVSKDPYFKDNHFRAQREFVDDKTTVFHLEEGLIEPIRHIAKCLSVNLGETIRVPVKNPGANLDVSVSSRAISMIEEFYSKDMSAFGYSKYTGEAGSG